MKSLIRAGLGGQLVDSEGRVRRCTCCTQRAGLAQIYGATKPNLSLRLQQHVSVAAVAAWPLVLGQQFSELSSGVGQTDAHPC